MLSDATLEEQLNQLNLSVMGLADNIDDLAIEVGRLDKAHGAHLDIEDRGIMSHSPSTVTIVPGQSESARSADACENCEATGSAEDRSPCLPPTDSEVRQFMQDADIQEQGRENPDEGAEPDHASGISQGAQHQTNTRRLRQSLSWPEVSKETVTAPTGRHRYSVCIAREYTSSLELIHNTNFDGDFKRVAYTQSAGSQEFTFHLPLNTSTGPSHTVDAAVSHSSPAAACHQESCESPVQTEEPSLDLQVCSSSSIPGEEQEPSCSSSKSEDEPENTENGIRIIYTSTGQSSPEQNTSRHIDVDANQKSPQIAYVTGTLNELFITDPTFQGVPAPLPNRTTAEKATGCPCGCHVRNNNDANPKTVHESPESSNSCDTGSASCDCCSKSYDGKKKSMDPSSICQLCQKQPGSLGEVEKADVEALEKQTPKDSTQAKNYHTCYGRPKVKGRRSAQAKSASNPENGGRTRRRKRQALNPSRPAGEACIHSVRYLESASRESQAVTVHTCPHKGQDADWDRAR